MSNITKRKLTEIEVGICERNIKEMEVDIEEAQHYKTQLDYQLDKGIEIGAKIQRRKFQKEVARLAGDIKANQEVIDLTRKQIDEGVDIIDKKEEQ